MSQSIAFTPPVAPLPAAPLRARFDRPQLMNRQEGRHRLARILFYGHKGELRQH